MKMTSITSLHFMYNEAFVLNFFHSKVLAGVTK